MAVKMQYGTDPIIRSIADLDIYKIRILQYYWVHYRYSRGTFAFHNRKPSVRLADIVPIEALREEIAHVATLRFTFAHIAFLRSMGGFREDFLSWLQSEFHLSPITVERDAESGQFVIEADGLLVEITLWETLVMRIVIALYGREVTAHDRARAIIVGDHILGEKLAMLNARPRIKIIDYGTRRAWNPEWHTHVLGRALEEAQQNFIGTSNVMLAMEFGISALGTQAHEIFMLEHARRRRAVTLQGWDNPDAATYVRQSQGEVFRRWYELYGEAFSIALIDTFGEDAFFEDATPEFLHAWKGMRLDSGDPIKSIEQILTKIYPKAGVDPLRKQVVPSDALDVGPIIQLDARFFGRIGMTYGWGTHLTNALGEFLTALSIVMKLTHFEDFPTVKISNNLKKAQGTAKEIEIAKRIYGYRRRLSAECDV